MAKISPAHSPFIVVFATPQTALVQPAVFGMFDVPLMADIQLAQQRPKHDSLRSAQTATGNLMMALIQRGRNR
jgi:hypothetical protein